MTKDGKDTVLGGAIILVIIAAVAGWLCTSISGWIWLVSLVAAIGALIWFQEIWYTDEDRKEQEREDQENAQMKAAQARIYEDRKDQERKHQENTQARGWIYWGEAQMLPCPFCGKRMERSRLQAMFGGVNDFFATVASYDTSKGGKHIEQKCDSCGKVFESRLAPDAEAIWHGGSFHQWRRKM